jgi:capsid protein
MDYWSGFFGSYAQGAPITTGKVNTPDTNIDRIDSGISAKVRQQNHWLNLNGTDIPAMIQSSTARTIGVGITTQIQSKDKAFNLAAEEFIEEHGAIGVGELTNTHHFNSAMRAISDFDLLDGGVIIRHHYNPLWAIPYKYELVGVDMIDTSKSRYMYETESETTVAGIVMNRWRQVTHIWLYKDEQKRLSERVSIKDLTYYSEVWASIAQQAAISKLASVLPTLDRVDQYAIAELESAIESAKSGAYLKSDAFNEIMIILRDKVKMDASGSIKNSALYDMMTTVAQGRVKQSGLTPIPSADDIVFPNVARDGIYKQLNDTAEDKMAASQGMSAISMYGKAADANYSAIKFSAELDQLTANIRFDNISNKIIKDVHSRLIQVGIQIGRIPNRVAYWKNPAQFNRFSYLRNVSVDIEPSKTAAANEKNLALGIMTEKEIVEKRTGRKYEDFLDEQIDAEILRIQKRTKAFEAAGIPLPELVSEKPQTETK